MRITKKKRDDRDRGAADHTRQPVGLDRLGEVRLTPAHADQLVRCERSSAGPAHWRRRKRDSAHDALALSQITPRDRLRVLAVDMTEDLNLLVHMNVPVPCMAPQSSELVMLPHTLLEVRYPQQIMTENLPGTSFTRINQPRWVWHANVEHKLGVLCLGIHLPRNTPLREILWLAYTALAMQTWMFDERDAAGVLNREAARYWSLNRDKLPLTPTALLEERPN